MKTSARLLTVALLAALAGTFSISAMAQAKPATFESAAADMQAQVAKSCAKGYNKSKFKLSTIVNAYPMTVEGKHYVMTENAEDADTGESYAVGPLTKPATEAQARSLVKKQRCIPA